MSHGPTVPRSRATRDIDLLGRLKNTVDNLVAAVRTICKEKVVPDGMVFDPESVEGGRIKEDADYEGVRVRFKGHLDRARAVMQIDFGFGDTVFPKPTMVDYPTILGMPGPQLKGYPRETVVAEKFEAMVNRGLLNSRMKDFYDVWLLANQFDFDGPTLGQAMQETFAHRKTVMTSDPIALSDDFARSKDKHTQWTAFIRKGHLDHAPKDLKQVTDFLGTFLLPTVEALVEGKSIRSVWKAPGPWIEKRL